MMWENIVYMTKALQDIPPQPRIYQITSPSQIITGHEVPLQKKDVGPVDASGSIYT